MQSPVLVALLSLLALLCLVHAAPVQPERNEREPQLRQLMDSNGYEGYEWAPSVFHKRGAAFYPARGKKSAAPVSDMDRLADQYFDLPQF